MPRPRRSALVYTPERGEHCEIACWDNTADGWRATTVAGSFAGQDKHWIYLDKDGARLTFLRSRWECVVA